MNNFNIKNSFLPILIGVLLLFVFIYLVYGNDEENYGRIYNKTLLSFKANEVPSYQIEKKDYIEYINSNKWVNFSIKEGDTTKYISNDLIYLDSQTNEEVGRIDFMLPTSSRSLYLYDNDLYYYDKFMTYKYNLKTNKTVMLTNNSMVIYELYKISENTLLCLGELLDQNQEKI